MFYTIAGVFLAFILALHGYRKGSLAMSGALAAFAVGCVIFNAGPLFTVVLIVFYASGSFVTGVKSSVKARLTEEDALMAEKRKHGNRTGWQVLSNSLFQALLAALHLMLLDGRAWPDFNNHYSSILFYSYLR